MTVLLVFVGGVGVLALDVFPAACGVTGGATGVGTWGLPSSGLSVVPCKISVQLKSVPFKQNAALSSK